MSAHYGLLGEKGLKSNTYRGRAALGWREAVRGCQCCSPEMEVTPEEEVVRLKIPRHSVRRKEGRKEGSSFLFPEFLFGRRVEVGHEK